jgi:hypothetical protein
VVYISRGRRRQQTTACSCMQADPVVLPMMAAARHRHRARPCETTTPDEACLQTLGFRKPAAEFIRRRPRIASYVPICTRGVLALCMRWPLGQHSVPAHSVTHHMRVDLLLHLHVSVGRRDGEH